MEHNYLILMKITNNEKYIQVIADEGKRLTFGTEDIKNYSSFRIGCFPVDFDLAKVIEITEEEDEMNINAQREAIEKEDDSDL